jgi:hypothetical protein
MSPFLISQLLAACTLATGMAAFQFKERKHILRGWCVAALFGAAHFYILGSNEACFLVAITAVRFLISSFNTDARLMYFFMALAIGGYAVTYENPVSVLALAATLTGTYGSFHGSANAVRYAMMTAEVLWVVHNLIIWSPVAVVMEVLFFASNLIGLLRHRKAGAAAL